jgi:hypothetical protein
MHDKSCIYDITNIWPIYRARIKRQPFFSFDFDAAYVHFSCDAHREIVTGYTQWNTLTKVWHPDNLAPCGAGCVRVSPQGDVGFPQRFGFLPCSNPCAHIALSHPQATKKLVCLKNALAVRIPSRCRFSAAFSFSAL